MNAGEGIAVCINKICFCGVPRGLKLYIDIHGVSPFGLWRKLGCVSVPPNFVQPPNHRMPRLSADVVGQ